MEGGPGLFGDGCHFFIHAFLVAFGIAKGVEDSPPEEEEGDGSVEGEEPPVGEFLIVFLNAVVHVFAEDDFAFFLSESAGADGFL